MGNRNHRSGRRRRGNRASTFVDPDFAAALSGERTRPDSRRQGNDDRKARQLCRQVYQVLSLSLAGECGDDVLRDVVVESVEPGPNAARLVVRVMPPAGVAGVEVLERLGRVTPHLRGLVARAITRKRAPELAFLLAGAGSSWGEEVRP